MFRTLFNLTSSIISEFSACRNLALKFYFNHRISVKIIKSSLCNFDNLPFVAQTCCYFFFFWNMTIVWNSFFRGCMQLQFYDYKRNQFSTKSSQASEVIIVHNDYYKTFHCIQLHILLDYDVLFNFCDMFLLNQLFNYSIFFF